MVVLGRGCREMTVPFLRAGKCEGTEKWQYYFLKWSLYFRKLKSMDKCGR